MTKLLPFSFLVTFLSFFGIAWIIVDVDPDFAKAYIFAILVALIFLFSWNSLGLLLFIARTRIHKRNDPRSYVFTSYKMSAFVALFGAATSVLAILKLISYFNLFLTVVVVICIAVYSFLGKRVRKRD